MATMSELMTIGKYGNVSSRYVIDPETGEPIPNPDYIPPYERGAADTANVIRITGSPRPGTVGQLLSPEDATKALYAEVAKIAAPSYESPDPAYSSLGAPRYRDISQEPAYKNLNAMLSAKKLETEGIPKKQGKSLAEIEAEEIIKKEVANRAAIEGSGIVGTPEWSATQKAEEAEKKERTAQEALDKQLTRLGTAIEDVKGKKNLSSAIGWFEAMTPNYMSLSPQDKANARAAIVNLQELLQTKGLQELRASGVAPGSITEREWSKFAAMVANLDPTQDENTFMKQLNSLSSMVAEQKSKSSQNVRGAAVPVSSEAEASRLPKGTIVIINGRRAIVE